MRIATFMLIVLILLGGCAKEASESVKIGIVLPLSGPAAYYGEQAMKGMEIAKKELAQQFPDLNLQLYYEDSAYDAAKGVTAYHKLRNIDDADAIITAASHVSLAIQPLTQKDAVLQMAIFSSADTYSSPNDLTFRISTRNEIEATAIANLIDDKNYERVAVLYIDNDFGEGFKNSLNKKLNRTFIAESYLKEDVDFRTSLLKFKKYNPDAVFLVGTARHYSLILKQAHEAGLETQFLSMRSAEDPVLLKNAAEYAEGLIYTYPLDSDTAHSFSTAFLDAYNTTPDSYAAEGYEGFKLAATALIHCDKDTECTRKYLESVTNYPSVFGKLSFDHNGDVIYDFFYKIVKNGSFERYR